MSNLSRAYNWAITTCNAPKVGYSQDYRNRQTVNGITYYDCSSFIWYSLSEGGFDVKSAYKTAVGTDYTYNAITTANERAWLSALGFTQMDINGEWKSGDIVWRTGHTEMVYTGGTGRGVTMGAHSARPALDNQVSINSSESSASNWDSIWRYQDGMGINISLYVISAICGNFWQESNINPGIWEGLNTGTWTDLLKGYGLGQWTNTGGDTHGRLYQLHEYLINNGYTTDSAQGQIEFMIEENVWYRTEEASAFISLQDFLNSTSSDIDMLTKAFCIGWEGIHDASWNTRLENARRCYEYISSNFDNSAITEWIVGNRYLADNERLNNAVMFARYLSSYVPPYVPTVGKRTMPVWMMIRYF